VSLMWGERLLLVGVDAHVALAEIVVRVSPIA